MANTSNRHKTPVRTIRSVRDLADKEVQALREILAEWQSKTTPWVEGSVQGSEAESQFHARVFRAWNSRAPIPAFPVCKDNQKHPSNTGVEIGTIQTRHFTQLCSSSIPNKGGRFTDGSAVARTKPAAPEFDFKATTQETPVYITALPCFVNKTVQYEYKTKSGDKINEGNAVKHDRIRLRPGLTWADAMGMAFTAHDDSEVRRVKLHNSSVAVCLARRAVYHWSLTSAEEMGGSLHSTARPTPGLFHRPLLCRGLAEWEAQSRAEAWKAYGALTPPTGFSSF